MDRSNAIMNRAGTFLAAYRACGRVGVSAEAAGIRRQQHYRRLEKDAKYRKAFAEAHREFLIKAKDEAEERAEQFHALEIGQVDQRIRALQMRWDVLRRGLAIIIEERGADMHDIPGGRSGFLCRDFKGKDANQEISRIDPGI